MKVGFIGLGSMGSPMARNLLAGGHEVRAWNRSSVDIEGITVVASPEDVFSGSDVVFTMLSDDDAIRQVLLEPGIIEKAPSHIVHVVTATISVAFARELAERHGKAGVGYVSAPVLGRPDVAATGELNILAAGAQKNVDAVRPLLELLAKRVWDMGEEPQQANAAKIACNMMITMAIEAMAEAVVLTEANDLPRDQFFELILGTLFGSRPYQIYSANIAKGSYDPGFKATLGLKDLRLAQEAAQDAGRTLPMLDAVHRRMGEAVEAGLGELDWSAMAEFTLNQSGPTPKNKHA